MQCWPEISLLGWDNATGVWIDDFPITPDRVLKALGKARGE
jgi:hypothetical protein